MKKNKNNKKIEKISKLMDYHIIASQEITNNWMKISSKKKFKKVFNNKYNPIYSSLKRIYQWIVNFKDILWIQIIRAVTNSNYNNINK